MRGSIRWGTYLKHLNGIISYPEVNLTMKYQTPIAVVTVRHGHALWLPRTGNVLQPEHVGSDYD
jgi:hypothetical protein